MKDTGNYKQANNRTAKNRTLVDECVCKQETVPGGNKRTLETDQRGLGGGGQGRGADANEAAHLGSSGALLGGQGWRKLWLCGGPPVFGVIGS